MAFPSTTNLVAYFKLDEISGGRNDSFGVNHLTDVNTVGSAAGKISNAAQFVSASAERLTIVDNAALSFGSSALSIAAWVYLNSKPAATMAFVSKYTAVNATSEYILGWSTTDRFIFQVHGGGGVTNVFSNTFGAPALSTWYHVVGWFDPAVDGFPRIAVNAGGVDNGGGIPGAGHDTTTGFILGADAGGTRLFDGRLDEVGIWKRALTAGERTDLYNGGTGITYSAQSQAPRSMHQRRLRAVV